MVGAKPTAKNCTWFPKEHPVQVSSVNTDSYAKVIANSKRVRWDIEDDVLRGRRYVGSGAMQSRFQKVLFATLSAEQVTRVNDALAPLPSAAPASPIVEPA